MARFKVIIILYIVGSALWGINQQRDKMDLNALQMAITQGLQESFDIRLNEKELEVSKIPEQLEERETSRTSQKSAFPEDAAILNGKAFVTSGITFKLITPASESWRSYIAHNVHLYGVDTCAPRQKAKLNNQEWPCGAVTTAWLVTKTLGQDLSCRQIVMRNGIHYAQCSVHGIDLAEAGLSEGMFVLSKEKLSFVPTQYRSAEEAARTKKVGLWSSDFTEPSQWRKDNGSYNPFEGT